MDNILLIGEDAQYLLKLESGLVNEGFKVELAHSEAEIAQAIGSKNIRVVVADQPSVNANAMKFAQSMRQVLDTIPLVIISEETPTEVVVDLLDAGADLFLSKPLDHPELAARIKALLRRHHTEPSWDALPMLVLDPSQRVVRINKRDIQLTRIEFELLNYLAEHNDAHHPARHLLHNVWEYPKGSGDTALVRNHIRNLRNKIEEDPERPRIVESLPKRGYRVNAEVYWSRNPVA